MDEQRPAPKPAAVPPKPDSAANIVLGWRREGGIAGFCDELNISVAGEFKAMSCKSPTSKNGILSKEDLARLDRWRKTFGSVNLQSKDSPGSDAMTLTLTLRGTGSSQPTEAERKEILDWVQKLYNQNRP